MSRAKSRQNLDVCADCGATEPTWASLNRGILLCIQCCSIHRSLGRHVSQIKSLQKSNLTPTQLSTLHALNNSGVNNLWEHSLLENGSKHAKRKPSPKDGIGVKAEFIRAKHQQLAFAFRPNNEDGLVCVENELGKQLHSSVRTGNLDTSFRLLIQGADPNYFHDEKGTTPLHVAAKTNQKEQAELLLIYGADPTFPDVNGSTPIDYARQGVNKDLTNRLIENQYEVTDKFSYYLCLRKPDHGNGVHFIIPQTPPKCDSSVLMKLQKLPNHVFEELAMDIYDEIDRREIESIWLSSADTLELSAVPHLPVDPSLSTTRNQSRQKLGRFTTPELKALVHDILLDTKRRQLISEKSYNSKGLPQLREMSQVSDDDPLYDSVASDDDYAIIAPRADEVMNESDKSKTPSPAKSTDENHNPHLVQTQNKNISNTTLELLTKKLLDSDSTISELKSEVSNLKALVEHLSSENYELKSRLSQAASEAKKINGSSGSYSLDAYINVTEEQKPLTNGHATETEINDIELRTNKKPQRPSSMYETREGLRTPNWQTLKHQIKQNEQTRNTIQGLYSNSEPTVVKQCTDNVTKCIQDLWNAIQGPGKENCMPYATKTRFAVHNFVQALPGDKNAAIIQHILDCVQQLQINCSGLQSANKAGDEVQTTNYVQKVRMCAYEIAKDIKLLVTKYSPQ